MLVDLETIKKHLNLDEDFTEDDKYLEMLEGVAETLVQKHIDISFDDLIDNSLDGVVATEGEVPQPLLYAILLFIGNMYENRESVSYTSISEVPMSLKYILDMYRNYNQCNI